MFKYQHWTSPVFFQSPHSSYEAHTASWIPQGCMFRSSQYMKPCLFLYFLEFPLLAQSSHPSRSFTGQTSSHLLSTWLGLDAEGFLDESWCHALWMEKSKRKKAPGTGFSRPLRIPLFQSCFWKSFCRFLKQFLAYYSVSVWRAVIGWSRGWCNRSSSWAACGYRFADVRQQVRVTGQLLDIYPILLSVGQTASDKCLQIPQRRNKNQ